jgi:hypothetical protein
MEEIQNYSQVVVNLDTEGGISVNTPTTTFEEAFMGEDFSEAQGKRRAKKQTRKLQKTADKRERKTAKRGKKTDRQLERVSRRGLKKSAKQDIRDQQSERRQTRRSRRPSAADRIVSAREKMQPEEEYVDETFKEGYQDDSYDENYYPSDEQDDQQYESESPENGYEDEDGGYYEEDEDDTYYGDESEDEDDTYYGDESEGVDDELIYDDENNFTGELTGKAPIPKEIMDCCMKIEWNDELISRLKDAKQKNSLSDVSTMRIQDIIDEKQSRMNELKSSLSDYAAGSPEQAAITKQARLKARQERMKICPYPIRKRLRDRGMSDQQVNEWWTKTGQQKIEQKMSNASGVTTVSSREESSNIAEFEAPVYDYDQPKTQVVNVEQNGEIKSNFTGENKDFWKSVLIGSVVGFTAIYLINKYKLLK